jgi:hypothetical protein
MDENQGRVSFPSRIRDAVRWEVVSILQAAILREIPCVSLRRVGVNIC